MPTFRPTSPRRIPFAWLACACLVLALPLLAQTGGPAGGGDGARTEAHDGARTGAGSPAAAEPEVLVVEIRSPIHAVSAQVLSDAVAEAESSRAAALVIEIDTPGGLMTSMRDMTRTILASSVPVVVYVAPAGAQAASAGFFILMSADVAAMAPGTNAGAASPVGPEGKDIEGTLGKKVEQDAAAQIRSLAKRNGRNVELAEEAVTKARSFDAEEALDDHLVDLVAPTLPKLLEALDGRTVRTPGGEPVVLATRHATVRRLEPSAAQRFLGVLATPDIAFLLLSMGSLGLLLELYHPGAVFPGVIGGICLILGFFALSVLPVNAAGLALIGLALIFFIAEIKVTSYGLLTVAGVVSLVLGSLMLFKSADPALRVSAQVIVASAGSAMVVVMFLMFQVLRAHRRQVRTGLEGMVHEHGRARSALDPAGKVFVHGEIWEAVADAPVAAGEAVEVVAVEGMVLRVRGLAAPAEVLAQGIHG